MLGVSYYLNAYSVTQIDTLRRFHRTRAAFVLVCRIPSLPWTPEQWRWWLFGRIWTSLDTACLTREINVCTFINRLYKPFGYTIYRIIHVLFTVLYSSRKSAFINLSSNHCVQRVTRVTKTYGLVDFRHFGDRWDVGHILLLHFKHTKIYLHLQNVYRTWKTLYKNSWALFCVLDWPPYWSSFQRFYVHSNWVINTLMLCTIWIGD